MRGELRDQIGYTGGGGFWLFLDILNDNVWSGENLAGLIEVIRRRCGQSYGLQYLQELEFVCCYMRVLFDVDITVPAYNHFCGLAARSLNLKRRHLR